MSPANTDVKLSLSWRDRILQSHSRETFLTYKGHLQIGVMFVCFMSLKTAYRGNKYISDRKHPPPGGRPSILEGLQAPSWTRWTWSWAEGGGRPWFTQQTARATAGRVPSLRHGLAPQEGGLHRSPFQAVLRAARALQARSTVKSPT